MRLLKNYEVRKSLLLLIFILLVFAGAILWFLNHFISSMNNAQIRQNISLVGSVAKRYPGSEEDIVRIIVSGDNKDYGYGKEILNKYSYDESQAAYKNTLMNESYNKLLFSAIVIIILLLVFIVIIMIYSYNKIFKRIRRVASEAEGLVEGRFGEMEGENEDGDFGVLVYQFNTMAHRMTETLEALQKEKLFLKRIITDISHQLKTPLASLIMFNEILSDHDKLPKDDTVRFVKESKNQLERMEWLVKNLLKMAKLEGRMVTFEKQEFSIEKTILQSIEGLKTMAEAKGLNIVLEGPSDIVVSHDINWTAEAISNIFKNSIEHVKPGGNVKVSWEENNVFVEIRIEDDGEGISKSELPLIFDRFHKGPNSNSPTNIGIGLFIAKNAIEGQGGNVYAYSEEKRGSKFVIRIMKKVWG
ncbi:sensor histidine kinase [Pseudobacteroides cellulosolvens]|uniref:histidine kinase n=1 Tax=Pseudobacteroides cellulosolvens ATCC 35603 = DSM 2933 TaxID=398512 RepID=A0A0L6JLK3_9FIRM|nr:HAMP domain-containing sensor histidine kinase [Pseudobacteroides cellulosolvens]KNY26640.1 integral membrane sensor signal transduction histidine kinase [Pseudobacteroides cellulosolvens ATCC 35603 = DSM 2933]